LAEPWAETFFQGKLPMVSSTRQTERRRAIRARAFGKGKKLEQTPKFPVHPEGYDAKKADAKKAAS
jgi:hypothetical protein